MKHEITNRIQDLTIDCPECENIYDEQYTCMTCNCQGGNGQINVRDYLIKETSHECSQALLECENQNDLCADTDIVWLDLEEAQNACLRIKN